MKMTQSTASLRLLTRRQRGCIFSDEEETLDCCILRCQKRKILGICGCLPWFLASSEEPECSIQQYSCLIQHADRLQHPKCNCRLPCRHIAYDCIRFITKKNFKLRSSCEYVISHWPTVQYQRKTLFGWLDLLVSFGGVAGLFLGYSLLTSVEFIYYFTLRSYCGAVLNTPNQRHNIVRLRTVKPKAQMNLNGKQKYYNYIQ
ncbi:sodium channel protein Nach isoform X4 [Cephus cinctus]|nr:sodium channel protein Nach isoform X4 [Cephus cinctus]XP_015593909.1 sodium channel protein Nach isoform X4 [Cephus cinctus]